MKQLAWVAIIILATVLPAEAQSSLWVRPLDFTPLDIITDAAGNSVVTGQHVTCKYDPSGNELWRQPYGGWLAMTASGDIYVKDDSTYEGGSFSFHKFDSQGGVLWSLSDYNVMGTYTLVHVDRAGNVFAYPAGEDGMSLVHIDPNKTISIVASVPPELEEKSIELQSDDQLNCYLLIGTGVWGDLDSIGVMKISANGTIPWRYMFLRREHHEDPSGSLIDYLDVSWDPFHLTVDRLGNCYLWGTMFTEHDLIDPVTSYYPLSSNIIRSRIEFIDTKGREKSAKIDGRGQIKISYKDNGVRYTEIAIENSLTDLRLSPQGAVYAYGYMDNRRWRRNPGFNFAYSGSLEYYVQRMVPGTVKAQWRKVFFRWYDGQASTPPRDITYMDALGQLFVPWLYSQNCIGCYDAVEFYAFTPTGNASHSQPMPSAQFFQLQHIQFDVTGNLYGIVNANITYQGQNSLVKYGRFTFGGAGSAPAAGGPEAASVPDESRLLQNYPNPFNPTTTISFELKDEALVTLKVYNTLGQEVAQLLRNERMDQGQQEVEFDASTLPSGVYFYRITAEPPTDGEGAGPGEVFIAMKKMLLVK